MPELSHCRAPTWRRPRSRTTGFTLAELAVVLVILALLTGSMLVPLGARMEARDRQRTADMLRDIEQALTGFAIVHGRLPCPSSEADPASPHYGLEDAAPCSMAAEGRLPWRTLGMPAHDAWGTARGHAGDDWAGHWRYRVDAAFVAGTLGADTAPTSNLQIRADDGSAITTLSDSQAVAIVLSTGPNRRADGHNATYSAAAPLYEAGDPSADFDDLLVWIGRPLLVARLAQAGRL
ncbi:MAG: type II secretion system protein [Betaproteobacteria bacterium]|nr:MAG: type II secretion system protein [Betaproteobacteria bacterium]